MTLIFNHIFIPQHRRFANIILLISALLAVTSLLAQDVPASYSNMGFDKQGRLYLQVSDTLRLYADTSSSLLTLENLLGDPKGTEEGIAFNFRNPDLNGTLYYGFIPYEDARYPLPVYFARTAKIKNGMTEIKIKKRMSGRYDMIHWEKKGKGTLGYRVVDDRGNFLYDGIISFKGTGPFEIDDTIIEGPFVNLLTDQGAVISFDTNTKIKTSVTVDGKKFEDTQSAYHHEISLNGLKPSTRYTYTIHYGANSLSYDFKTAPQPGSRRPFVFAYASDSRAGRGGGERSVYGVNHYITKRIIAYAAQQQVSFVQFTGDIINGYATKAENMDLQYANWKRAVSPFGAYFPIIVGMGNHEALIHRFPGIGRYGLSIDRFPFEDQSSEAIFARHFVNPLNGPLSEDGSIYDPNMDTNDFPSYKENVFYYNYDNSAIIVLNSDYWYAPSLKYHNESSGNLHGYVMDKQFDWLKQTLIKLENDKNVDHIFVTIHTPFFPNGGHVGDAMYYNGSNEKRAYVAGKPVAKGIIERRDELLDLFINKSTKVVAILTGDEHNYCRTLIGPQTSLYPEEYAGRKLKLRRSIWQINNGAAGSPYYAQEITPWSAQTQGFTTQNAVVLVYVHGQNVDVKVYNPDTLEPVDRFNLKNTKQEE